jgi:hypothetical protein
MTRSTRKARWAVLVTGAGLALGVAMPATAGAAEPTHLTITKKLPRFVGHVESTVRRCEQDRTVILFRKEPGPNKRVGRDHSEDSGRWAIDVERERFQPGTYYAVAPRATRGAVDCARDRTRDVRARSF